MSRIDRDDKTLRHGDQMASIPAVDEQAKSDAWRAITHQHLKVAPVQPHPGELPLSGLRELIEMLGLVEVEGRTEDAVPVERAGILAAVDHPDRLVRCPTCNALPGAACTVYTRYDTRPKVYQRGHIERHRRAEERS